MDGAFERALSMRLRAELDGLRIAVPIASPARARSGSIRFVLGVGRPLAVALGVALLLGSVAAAASGSPNPANWVTAAERTLGIPTSGDRTPSRTDESPSPTSTESPEPTDKSNGTEREATGSPEPAEHQSPEPTSPEAHDSPGPAEHSSGDG